METWDIADPSLPEYNALSYTWGTAGRTVPITVDGKTLGITPSLAEAMAHMEQIQQRE